MISFKLSRLINLRFFESRHDPVDAPLILWLSGGPGCSSTTGLLFELGPCSIVDEGKNVTHNPYSWNSHANIIFLDQPVGTGFSYSKDETVNNTPDAAKDIYAFLQLFLGRFRKYADAPFHVAAESYGGTYGPHIASVIHGANKDVAFAPAPGIKHINLASVILANGWTDPYIQVATVPEYACEGPYPVYDDPNGVECTTLKSKVPTCQRLIQSCYRTGSKFACVPALLYCNSQLYGKLQRTCPVLFG
jgi:cathepsin A (carboxypeptidase C)